MTLRLVILASVVLLAGCTSGATLRHPQTGRIAQCGPYALKFGIGHMEQERCLNDYQRQGYERVPE